MPSAYYLATDTTTISGRVSNCGSWRRSRPSRQVLADTGLFSIVHGQACISFVTVFASILSFSLRNAVASFWTPQCIGLSRGQPFVIILPGHLSVSACRAVSPLSSSLSSGGDSEVVLMVVTLGWQCCQPQTLFCCFLCRCETHSWVL